MLVYSKNKVYPKVVNMITLEVCEEGYVYVQKGTYDQALTLKVKQGFDSLMTLLDCGDNNAEAIVFAFENLPEPVNMLAPFLGLVKEEIGASFEEVIGVLHVITTSISPYNFVRKPKEIRKTLEFSGSVKREYQESWKAFHLQCVSEDMLTIGVPFPVYGQVGVYPQVPSMPKVNVNQQESTNPQPATGEVMESTTMVERGMEAGTEVDLTREDLEADPNWEYCGDGLWFNNETGAMLAVDEGNEEDLDAEFEALLAESREESASDSYDHQPEEVKPTNNGGSKPSALEALKAKMNK